MTTSVRAVRTRITGRVLLAPLVLVWWTAGPGAGGARAEEPAALPRRYAYPAALGAAGPGGHAAEGGATDAGAAVYLVLPVAVLLAAVAVASYTFVKRRRRMANRTTPGGAPADRGTSGGSGPPPRNPSAEPVIRAERALIGTDDAVRARQEELAFAAARSGAPDVARLTEAVAFAEGELTVAFRLRQELDDAPPPDDRERRGVLAEILARCARADARLDAEAEGFDRLRAPERNVPEALGSVALICRALAGRAATARETLGTLRGRYADTAVAPVADDTDEAGNRLMCAGSALDEARGLVDAGDTGGAAARVRAARSAAGQAAVLVEAVERRARELAEAAGMLPGALTGTETDLAEARGLPKDGTQGAPVADLQGRIGRAEAMFADVRREVAGGRYDPIDALRRIGEADTLLDGALTGACRPDADRPRTGALLDQAMLTARSAAGAATAYITAHRGVVGAPARTRLAESRRLLEWARGRAAAGDAHTARSEARRADALARQARDLAERDVRSHRGRSEEGTGAIEAGSGAGGGGAGGRS
ncbi:TPM domain-containing protein [Streptomyces sp. NPDC088258]|uniref:TPM domain-containing protein n=1 Tax=Streptomyces sp. NPDC088258 TaxID=3365849 RepID=UPI003807C4CC